MFRKSSKKGFSLVELLVVITIIAILSVVAYTAIGGHTITARDAKRKQDVSTIQNALELYIVEYNRYPESLATGDATPAAGWKIPKKYLSDIPLDPNGDAYVYSLTGDKKSYLLGATLEYDGIFTSFKAYVVGNGDAVLLNGKGCTSNNGTETCAGACNIVNNEHACLSYHPND